MPRKKQIKIDLSKDKIERASIDNVSRQSFLDYSIMVASDRATPNVLDGLKPVQRRILYAMNQMKLSPTAKHVKSARITGEVMGKYHPHSDSYESLDVLTQNFTFQLPLIDGRGSFGDISGNTPAAARYTEARLSQYGQLYVENNDPKIINYIDNYDNTLKMPTVFPVQIPALLINGTRKGIAVGFTTSIPSHNPIESLKLVSKYLENPNLTLDQMLKIMPGPDFPTGGTISGDFKKYYQTGICNFINTGIIQIDDTEKDTLIITEVPYNMAGSIESFIQKTKEQILDKKLPGIKSIDNYSSQTPNIQIKLERNFDPQKAIALLYNKTTLRSNYGCQWVALDSKTPKVFNLPDYLETFTDFQHKITIRKFKAVLNKSIARNQIVEALLTVPDILETIIFIAKTTQSKNEMIQVLTGQTKLTKVKKTFNYSEQQANAIASMRIHQLNRIDQNALNTEKEELDARIYWAKRYINEKDLRIQYLIKQNEQFIETFKKAGFKRKTKILQEDIVQEYVDEKLILDVTVAINKYGYIKMTDRKDTSAQDIIETIDTTDNDNLIIFTQSGNMYQTPLSKLKKYTTRDQSRGDSVFSIFENNGLKPDDAILCYTTKSQLSKSTTQLIFISAKGSAKRTPTHNSKFITKTMRKQLDAWKPKFENDHLIFATIIDQTQLDQYNVIVISNENKYKAIPVASLNEIGATGSGSNTFIPNKSNESVINEQCFIYDKDLDTCMKNVNGTDINIMSFDILKPTQTFKPLNLD